ncbi:MAG TPA: hypothetical protein VG096_09585 [Bryobacteraceae bacterium]|jgi:hypothetical protein|nr:hypothetical protein [Bryobacteraceae bacterium]
MFNEADLAAMISGLRLELGQIDRAILVFEDLASQKKPCRSKPSRTSPVRLKEPDKPPSGR